MAHAAVAAPDAGGLWLAALQRGMGRASHDVRDALNGVSVNVEVIRSRAARPELPASALAPFAGAAAQQAERLTRLIEAVLALGRPERDPADVALALRHIAIVCGASSSNGDATVELHYPDGGLDGPMLTRVGGNVMRLALMAPLLAAVTGNDRAPQASPVLCALTGDESHITVTMSAPGRRTSMPADAGPAIRAAGVVWTEQSQDLSLAFPRA